MLQPEGAPILPKVQRRRARIVLVDDHAILRDAVRAKLHDESDLEVVGEAATIDAAVELAARLHPDLMITDIAFRKCGGIQAIGRLRRASPGMHVLILTQHNSAASKRAAVNAGADACVAKSSPFELLLDAIREAIDRMRRGSAAGRSARVGTPFHDLTPRQIEVLIAIGLGSSSQEMAKKLGLSVKTIYKHRSQLMRKLGLRNAAQVTRFAIANGFTTAGDDTPALRVHTDPG